MGRGATCRERRARRTGSRTRHIAPAAGETAAAAPALAAGSRTLAAPPSSAVRAETAARTWSSTVVERPARPGRWSLLRAIVVWLARLLMRIQQLTDYTQGDSPENLRADLHLHLHSL